MTEPDSAPEDETESAQTASQAANKRRFAGLGIKFNTGVTTAVATGTAVIGLVSATVALRNDIFRNDKPAEAPPAAVETQEPPLDNAAPGAVGPSIAGEAQSGQITAATVAQVADDMQLSQYEALLGPPLSKKRLQNTEWLVSNWNSTDIDVAAFSDRDNQVVAYTVTSLGPDYSPQVKYVPGGIRLRTSVFADVTAEPDGQAGLSAAKGRWSYEEFYVGSGETEGRSVVLAASSVTESSRAAAKLPQLSTCLSSSVFGNAAEPCDPDAVDAVRDGIFVTSMTIGESSVLETLDAHGAEFHPPLDQ